VSPELYAEVHVNVGAIYFQKRGDLVRAREHFETALRYRDLGSCRVNMALLALREGRRSGSAGDVVGREALVEAQGHCRRAIELEDDLRSVDGARRLLGDIEKMLNGDVGR